MCKANSRCRFCNSGFNCGQLVLVYRVVNICSRRLRTFQILTMPTSFVTPAPYLIFETAIWKKDKIFRDMGKWGAGCSISEILNWFLTAWKIKGLLLGMVFNWPRTHHASLSKPWLQSHWNYNGPPFSGISLCWQWPVVNYGLKI